MVHDWCVFRPDNSAGVVTTGSIVLGGVVLGGEGVGGGVGVASCDIPFSTSALIHFLPTLDDYAFCCISNSEQNTAV